MSSLGKYLVRSGLLKPPANDSTIKKAIVPKAGPTRQLDSGLAPNEVALDDGIMPDLPKGTQASAFNDRVFTHGNDNQIWKLPFKQPVTPQQEQRAMDILDKLIEQGDDDALNKVSKSFFGMTWRQAKKHPALQKLFPPPVEPRIIK